MGELVAILEAHHGGHLVLALFEESVAMVPSSATCVLFLT